MLVRMPGLAMVMRVIVVTRMVMVVMMLATATFAMLMRMGMAVIVVVVTVLMPMVVMMMPVGMIMMMLTLAVVMVLMAVVSLLGGTYRLKRTLDLDHLRAESRQHFGKGGIGADTQPFRGDLRFRMPVAENPGEFQKMRRVAAPDLHLWLGLRNDIDKAAIIERQKVAVTQGRRLAGHERNVEAADRTCPALLAQPLLKGEDDAVVGLAPLGGVCGNGSGGERHGGILRRGGRAMLYRVGRRPPIVIH